MEATRINKETQMEPSMQNSEEASSGCFSLPINYSSSDVFQIPGGIEMVTLEPPVNYTSLQDLLPTAPPLPPEALLSQAYGSQQSWHDIPIKNPLVKHAAWAYLQPMLMSPSPSTARSFYTKLKEKCGCIGFLSEVVFPVIKEAVRRFFTERRVGDDREEEDDEVD